MLWRSNGDSFWELTAIGGPAGEALRCFGEMVFCTAASSKNTYQDVESVYVVGLDSSSVSLLCLEVLLYGKGFLKIRLSASTDTWY